MGNDLINSQVLIAVISTAGGIAAAFITVKYKDRIKRLNRSNQPKDRMETIFDGYEKLIKQQQEEIDRKGRVIESLENVVNRLEEELSRTRQLLNEAREDLSTTREQNEELKSQLIAMKKEYGDEKRS